MLINGDDAGELKTWIIKRLEDISDADSDVLADYVLALIRADTPEPELRASAIENLEDFLKSNTPAFVEEVFQTIHAKSYLPGFDPSQSVSSSSPSFAASSGPPSAYGSLAVAQGSHAGFPESRKRSYNNRQENGNGADPHYVRGDRQLKQMRRGSNRGRAVGLGPRAARSFQEFNYNNAGHLAVPSNFQNLPLPHQGPLFDPNDPIAAIAAMQAMGLPPMHGMAPLQQVGSQNGLPPLRGQGPLSTELPIENNVKDRCRDYDMQGFCVRGDACPYVHGTDRVIVPGQDEYDPKNATMLDMQSFSPTSNGYMSARGRRVEPPQRAPGRARGDRGEILPPTRRSNRADFSQAGPNYDRSITTIVVEQIPEEKFDDQSVRTFFSDFGNIEDVTMQPYKRLALVKFDNYTGAKRAYESPKVIFDNRFVKVYWYKPGTLDTQPPSSKITASSPTLSTAQCQTFNRTKFDQDAQTAQKKLEEKKAQLKDVEMKRQTLEKRTEELAVKQAEEKRRLLEKLSAKGACEGIDQSMVHAKPNGADELDDGNVSAHTKALREKVAELEAEAKSLGLYSALTESPSSATRGRGRGRGRGSYRGWEGFAGRAGYDTFRGGTRGRGYFRGRGGGAYNLDNRTKKVGVTGVAFDNQKDEALRQYLLGIGEFEAIEPHQQRADAQVITFKDRATAESFIYGPKEIPSVGKVEFSWQNSTACPTHSATTQGAVDGVAEMSGANADGDGSDRGTVLAAEPDYDVAEDYDRWMIE